MRTPESFLLRWIFFSPFPKRMRFARRQDRFGLTNFWACSNIFFLMKDKNETQIKRKSCRECGRLDLAYFLQTGGNFDFGYCPKFLHSTFLASPLWQICYTRSRKIDRIFGCFQTSNISRCDDNFFNPPVYMFHYVQNICAQKIVHRGIVYVFLLNLSDVWWISVYRFIGLPILFCFSLLLAWHYFVAFRFLIHCYHSSDLWRNNGRNIIARLDDRLFLGTVVFFGDSASNIDVSSSEHFAIRRRWSEKDSRKTTKEKHDFIFRCFIHIALRFKRLLHSTLNICLWGVISNKLLIFRCFSASSEILVQISDDLRVCIQGQVVCGTTSTWNVTAAEHSHNFISNALERCL